MVQLASHPNDADSGEFDLPKSGPKEGQRVVMSNGFDHQRIQCKRLPSGVASGDAVIQQPREIGSNVWEDLGEMVGEQGPERPDQRGPLGSPLFQLI